LTADPAAGAERCPWNLAGPPNFGVEMIRRRGAKPRRHHDVPSGAGRKQHAPPLHLDRGEGLLAKPFEDRRSADKKRGETSDSLALLDD
jgi:hypothetical protein